MNGYNGKVSRQSLPRNRVDIPQKLPKVYCHHNQSVTVFRLFAQQKRRNGLTMGGTTQLFETMFISGVALPLSPETEGCLLLLLTNQQEKKRGDTKLASEG